MIAAGEEEHERLAVFVDLTNAAAHPRPSTTGMPMSSTTSCGAMLEHTPGVAAVAGDFVHVQPASTASTSRRTTIVVRHEHAEQRFGAARVTCAGRGCTPTHAHDPRGRGVAGPASATTPRAPAC